MRHRLALALGCSVRELGDRISADEWTQWQAFYLLEPWGYMQQDIHAAVVASTVANYSGLTKDPRPITSFLTVPPPEPTPTEVDGEANLERIFRRGPD